MFKSKVRPIVIPQYEHGRLAGTLASVWGNQDFDKPALDFAFFRRGVALHDWHYGIVDNLPINEANEADWLKMTRRGVEYWFDNPITDLVVKLHLKRLLSWQSAIDTTELVQLIELRLVERLPQCGFFREQFEWADKITQFCDSLAFDFSFEEPVAGRSGLYAKRDASQETVVSYEIKPGGQIWVEPWPFSVDEISGIIIGYQQAGFPEQLTPEIVPFQLKGSQLSGCSLELNNPAQSS